MRLLTAPRAERRGGRFLISVSSVEELGAIKESVGRRVLRLAAGAQEAMRQASVPHVPPSPQWLVVEEEEEDEEEEEEGDEGGGGEGQVGGAHGGRRMEEARGGRAHAGGMGPLSRRQRREELQDRIGSLAGRLPELLQRAGSKVGAMTAAL